MRTRQRCRSHLPASKQLNYDDGVELMRSSEADEVADRLRAVVGRFARALRAAQVSSALSPSQRDVLRVVVRRGPIRLASIAADEGMNLTMVSRIVSHLERESLVKRTLDPDDERVVHVASTRAGRRLAESLRRERTAVLVQALGTLGERDLRRLNDVLPILDVVADAVSTVRR